MEALIGPGIPVEIGQIDRELGKLWESSGDTRTRASLINLVIYSEAPKALATNTEMIAAIAGQYACRAILILADPQAAGCRTRAWIDAHCRLLGQGGREVCSEQITFLIDGSHCAALPGIVFSHLDSDLPLCLWWQAGFCGPTDEALWAWVDRLIFDSAVWSDPASQWDCVCKIGNLGKERTVLCDLNWTRLIPWRSALAAEFDHAAALARLPELTSLHVRTGSGGLASACLLLGWLADRLDWTPSNPGEFLTGSGRRVTWEISQAPEDGGIVSVEACAGDACFRIARQEDAGLFRMGVQVPGFPVSGHTLRATAERPADTLVAELSRGGRHPLYKRALAIARQLLQGSSDIPDFG